MVKYLEGYIDHMKIRQKFHVSMNVVKVGSLIYSLTFYTIFLSRRINLYILQIVFNDKTNQFHVQTENTATKVVRIIS